MKLFSKTRKKLANTSNNLSSYYKTFNNCLEQGLMLEIYDNNNNDDGLLIWACENRNSNKIMIVLADKSCCNANDMFDNKAWQSARYFDANDYDTAIDFTYNVIENNLIKIL